MAIWPPVGLRSNGFFFAIFPPSLIWLTIMTKVCFLVDGFNLYHSTKYAEGVTGSSTKWLDLKKLLFLYHSHYTEVAGNKISWGPIFYFTAYANHRIPVDPDVVNRHKKLIECFKDSGVKVIVSQFKEKGARCPNCSHRWIKHEEKETDVAIALKLIEIFHNDWADLAVVVTGDTDLAPAVSTSSRLFPDKQVIFAFPFGRKNKSLKISAPQSFKIKCKAYTNNQFPDPYILSDGTQISKPGTW